MNIMALGKIFSMVVPKKSWRAALPASWSTSRPPDTTPSTRRMITFTDRRASSISPDHAVVHRIQPLRWQDDPQAEAWTLADLEYTVPPVFLKTMLVFRTEQHVHPVESTEGLMRALEITLSQCRTLTGAFIIEGGEIKIVRNRGASVPFIVQHNMSASFKDLEASGFPESVVGKHAVLDKTSLKSAHSITNGQQPLCEIQATWIAGGLIITAGWHHYCMDGAGFWAFLRQWARTALALKDNIEVPPPWDPSALDRHRLNGRFHRPDERTDPPPHPQAVLPVAASAHPSRLVILHIDNVQISRLKAAARPLEGKESSAYDSITALLWRVHTRARLAIHDPQPDDVTFLGQAVDLRSRFSPPLGAQLQANAMLGVLTPPIPVRDAVADEKLPFLASLVRQTHTGATEEAALARANVVAALQDKTLAAWKGGGHVPRFAMAMSDWRRGGLYEADFGFGRPVAWRAVYQPGHPSTVTELPRDGTDGATPGLEVQIPVEVPCLDCFVRDAELLRYAKVVCT